MMDFATIFLLVYSASILTVLLFRSEPAERDDREPWGDASHLGRDSREWMP